VKGDEKIQMKMKIPDEKKNISWINFFF